MFIALFANLDLFCAVLFQPTTGKHSRYGIVFIKVKGFCSVNLKEKENTNLIH